MTWALVITYCWLTHGVIECERSVRTMPDHAGCAAMYLRALHVKSGPDLAFTPRCVLGFYI